MEQEFTEFGKFRESDKSMKHEWESIYRSCLSHVSWWCCGNILVSNTRGARFEPFYHSNYYFVTEFAEFNENI